jgi:hypothetical protein
MGTKLNLEGDIFGRLTVIEYLGNSKWRCKCICGNESVAKTGKLTGRTTKSCGCWRVDSAKNIFNDLTGKKFGRLLVIRKTDKRLGRKIIWECLCDCGKTTEVLSTHFENGTSSCGCYKSELCRQNAGKLIRYGSDNANWKGGITSQRHQFMHSPEYLQWRDAVFQRDNYKCHICGCGGYIQAHHIESYSEYEFFRTEIDNGITLCKKHHLEFHKTHGFTSFDSADWLEYCYDKFS